MEGFENKDTTSVNTDTRINDVKKAEEMAYAEKSNRDEIARTKAETDVRKNGISDEETGENLLKIAELNERANEKAEEAGKKYDIEQRRLEIAHKLENNENLSSQELEFLQSLKNHAENDTELKEALDYERKEYYDAGVRVLRDINRFVKERKKIEKEIGVLNNVERQMEIELRKNGEWNDTIRYAILKYRDEIEKEQALNDEKHPFHKDMVRMYNKLKEGQRAIMARMRKELEDTQSALRKLETVGMDENSLEYYQDEVDRICDTMSNFDSAAIDESYQYAKLNAIIDGKLKETHPLNPTIRKDYRE